MNRRRAFHRVRAPDELGAQERAWAVVRRAYAERAPTSVHRPRWRLAVAPVLAAIVAALALSPAGATVGRWISHALGIPHAARTLQSLPARGSLLVTGAGGTWTVGDDGSLRRLGVWREASWSPHGLYLAVAENSGLAAVDPHGTTHWLLARPQVRDPRWYPPSGYRVAYLSADQLRVVAGDGTGDHVVADAVEPVAPAWQPDHPYRLAYVAGNGNLVVRDADTGRRAWAASLPARPRQLTWSDGGTRLLVTGTTFVRLYNSQGQVLRQIAIGSILDSSLSPDGRSVAVIRGGTSGEALFANLAGNGALQRLLPGVGLGQVTWSPDGRWLLVSWPRANQWVFVRVAGRPRIAAVSHIAQDFANGSRPAPFPRIEGWCCTASGSAR